MESVTQETRNVTTSILHPAENQLVEKRENNGGKMKMFSSLGVCWL